MLKGKKALSFLLGVSMILSPVSGNVQAAEVTENISVKQAAESNDNQVTVTDQGLVVTWDNYKNAASYDVYRAESRYGTYKKVATVNTKSYEDKQANMEDKYANYYKIAVAGSNEFSDPISLEIDMFGEDMYVFSPKDDIEQVYNAVNDVYKIQGAVVDNGDGGYDATTGQQFGSGRYAFAFKTGDYTGMKASQFDMSYYMQLIGLGKVPTDVTLKNIHVPPVLPNWNITCNFWMDVENFTVAPETEYGSDDAWYNFMWSVSQAAPARRLNVNRNATFHFMWDGWASGGFVADSVFNNNVQAYTQQQYYLRNSKFNGGFNGGLWNLVTQGVTGMNVEKAYNLESGLGKTNWKSGGTYTVLDSTDVIREKPFLYFDEKEHEYKVFVPGLRQNATGVSWTGNDMGEGKSVDISQFYIARADRDNAKSINAALAAGKNIILSPGIYYAEEPIVIDKANTIVLGLGLATIIPGQSNTDTAMRIADVSGVSVAGIIFDAQYASKNMLVVGEDGCNKVHSNNPTALYDIFVRIGGVHPGKASTEQAVVINSNNVIGDDFWIWRADHGDGVGWNLNTAKNGVVVNGDDVTLYGLMVEHFQEYDVLWRGENGRTYFLQNEKCYDPQNQADWMSHDGTVPGYAAYKVTNNVKNHYAVGLGSYDVFINTNGASIFLDNAFEVPDTDGVKIENACIVEIASKDGPKVGFNHIINGTGPAISTGTGGQGYARQAVLSYCNKKSISLEDYYKTQSNNSENTVEEEGTTPTDDPKADKDISKEEKQDDPDNKGLDDENSLWELSDETEATGPYAEWRNHAITYPEKGQLLPAGFVNIQFNALENAVKYDVYADYKLIKTIEGENVQKANFEVEIRNNEVKKHTVCVVASLQDGTEVVSNIRNFYISKKGIGIWQSQAKQVKEMNNAWYYTWSPSPLEGVDTAEFVPMIWGNASENSSGDRKKEWEWLQAEKWKDYRYLLMFNEPDFPDQSNMTPEQAVERWQYIEPIVDDEKVDVSSPVVAIPTTFYEDTNNDYGTVGGWYGKYAKLMAEAEFHDEFTAVHFYFDYPGDWILEVLEDIHNVTGKPLWITEWGVGQWSQVQNFDWTGGPDEGNWQREIVTNFVKEILPQMDKLDYIERYAWFPFDGSNTEKFGNGAGGLFFTNGQLTSVGKAYKAFGNPNGWDPDKITEDQVVKTVGTSVDKEDSAKEDDDDSASTDLTENDKSDNQNGDSQKDNTNQDNTDQADNTRRNILEGKTATASSENGDNKANNAIDADVNSRWESQHGKADEEWIQVDLQDVYTVDGFKVVWEAAAAKEYKLQVSMDGKDWKDVYEVKNGTGGETKEDNFAPVTAKYVRLLGTSKILEQYGYSVFDFEVMGVKGENKADEVTGDKTDNSDEGNGTIGDGANNENPIGGASGDNANNGNGTGGVTGGNTNNGNETGDGANNGNKTGGASEDSANNGATGGNANNGNESGGVAGGNVNNDGINNGAAGNNIIGENGGNVNNGAQNDGASGNNGIQSDGTTGGNANDGTQNNGVTGGNANNGIQNNGVTGGDTNNGKQTVDQNVSVSNPENGDIDTTNPAAGIISGNKNGSNQNSSDQGIYPVPADANSTVNASVLGDKNGLGTNQTEGIAVGKTFESGKLRYRVTKAEAGKWQVKVVKLVKNNTGNLSIPASVTYQNQSFAVTSIAKNAFKNNKKLKSVVVGKSVTSIEKQAFAGCNKLSKVTIGKKVTTIGSKAFYNCKKLKKVTFKGGKLKKVGSKAFMKTSANITFKTGKKNQKKYSSLLRKKAPSTAKIVK